jgi:hypothetical protein
MFKFSVFLITIAAALVNTELALGVNMTVTKKTYNFSWKTRDPRPPFNSSNGSTITLRYKGMEFQNGEVVYGGFSGDGNPASSHPSESYSVVSSSVMFFDPADMKKLKSFAIYIPGIQFKPDYNQIFTFYDPPKPPAGIGGVTEYGIIQTSPVPPGRPSWTITGVTAQAPVTEIMPMPMQQKRGAHWSGDKSGNSKLSFDSNTSTLSFSDMVVTPTLKLSDGSESLADPLEGATIRIGTTILLGNETSQGWSLANTIIEYLVSDVPVLTAGLVNGFLFKGGGAEPQFDSELQYDLANISVNNFINSPYLSSLQTYTENGNSSFLSFYSNILASSNNLTTSSLSTGQVSVDGKVPEPSSVIGLLAIGTLGAASTLKRKLKPSKSSEKETTKVG